MFTQVIQNMLLHMLKLATQLNSKEETVMFKFTNTANTSIKKALTAVAATLALSVVQVTTASASEAIAQGSEGMSQGSGYIVEGSFTTTSGVASAAADGSVWVIRGIEDAGESVMVTMVNASQAGVEVSFAVSKGTAEALSLAAKGIYNLGVITAEGTSRVIGYTLSQGGKVMLYLANEVRDMRASSEQL